MDNRKRWAVVGALALAGGYLLSAPSAEAVTYSRASYAPTTSWSWVTDASLGNTETTAQYAQATVSGLSSADRNAGFRMRYGASGGVLVAVSGTMWKIEPSGGATAGGTFAHGSSGALRVEITPALLVKILWNGSEVASRTITTTANGLGVAPAVWQSSAGARLDSIEVGDVGEVPPATTTTTVTVTPTVTAPAVTVTAPAVTVGPSAPTATVTAPAVTVTPTVTITPTVTVTPTGTPTTTTTTATPGASPSPTADPPAVAAWLSGASSKYAVDGSYAAYRGEPVSIVGTWDDSKDAAAALWSLDGDLANLHSGSLDIAVGAIWNGQSWANAAQGAYNSQWQNTLNVLKMKLILKGISPSNVYIRFAHELNGSWTEWRVEKGQEANFREAIGRFSALRYDVFGSTGGPKVVLCANDGTSGGMADPRDLFVATDGQGRKVVDVYCIDTYNQYPHRTDGAAIWSAMNSVGTGVPTTIEEHRRFAEASGVPFSIGEWSNCGVPAECAGGGGESVAYVQQMNRYFRAHAGDPANPKAGQLIYEVQFNLWTRFAFYGSEARQPLTSAEYARQVWGN